MSHPILRIPQFDLLAGTNEKPRFLLRQLRLELHRGRCIALTGVSDSGKTLVAKAILNRIPKHTRVSSESSILFNGENLLAHSKKKLRDRYGKSIGYIPQQHDSIFHPLSTVGFQLRRIIQRHLRFTSRESLARALALLEQAGIANSMRCYRAYFHELSRDVQQSALIAYAIAAEPDLIIADEPMTGFDDTQKTQITELLQSLKIEKKCALLLICRGDAITEKLADEKIILQAGEIMERSIPVMQGASFLDENCYA